MPTCTRNQPHRAWRTLGGERTQEKNSVWDLKDMKTPLFGAPRPLVGSIRTRASS